LLLCYYFAMLQRLNATNIRKDKLMRKNAKEIFHITFNRDSSFRTDMEFGKSFRINTTH